MLWEEQQCDGCAMSSSTENCCNQMQAAMPRTFLHTTAQVPHRVRAHNRIKIGQVGAGLHSSTSGGMPTFATTHATQIIGGAWPGAACSAKQDIKYSECTYQAGAASSVRSCRRARPQSPSLADPDAVSRQLLDLTSWAHTEERDAQQAANLRMAKQSMHGMGRSQHAHGSAQVRMFWHQSQTVGPAVRLHSALYSALPCAQFAGYECS